MNLFTTLETAMLDGEGFNLQVVRKGKRLSVTYIPMLGKEDENANDDLKQVRASLSLPMQIVDTPANLDSDFEARLTDFTRARESLVSAQQALIESLGESTKKARNTAAAASKTVAKPKQSGSAKPEPSTPTDAESNDTPTAATSPNAFD